MVEIKRQTAYKVRISEVLNGRYVVLEGWDPNYVIINNKKISRVNIIGTVIGKNTDNSLIIDDGSGQIAVRNFENQESLEEFDLGDIVLVIGRPREYNDDKYIMSEVVKATSTEWLLFRKKENELFEKLGLGEEAVAGQIPEQNTNKETVVEEVKEETIKEEIVEDIIEEKIIDEEINSKYGVKEEIVEQPKSKAQKIIEYIQKIDAGDGVPIDEIINEVGDCEETINMMVQRGDIFENKSGRVKLL